MSGNSRKIQQGKTKYKVGSGGMEWGFWGEVLNPTLERTGDIWDRGWWGFYNESCLKSGGFVSKDRNQQVLANGCGKGNL